MDFRSLLIFSLSLIFSYSYSHAKDMIVTDSVSGLPLSKASVFDNKGKLIGFCSQSGQLPYISDTSYPITIGCLGYNNAVVNTPEVKKIVLRPMDFKLPELTVDGKKRNVLHMLCYLREYSTIATYTDTVMLFREKTIDFMIPTPKVKRYSGRTFPRILASKSYYRFTNSSGLDSVSKFFSQNFSWSDLVGVVKAKKIPESLRNVEIGTDTVHGKFSPSSIWRKHKDIITLDNDILADKNNQTWAPDLFELFSRNVEFTNFKVNYEFTAPGTSMILPDDISKISFIIESQGRGTNLRSLFKTFGPIYISTYGEIYVTEREYITVKEALKWEKNPPLGDEIGINYPSEIPPLPHAIVELKDRVDNFDVAGMLIKKKTDSAYRVMKKFENRQKKKGIISRILNR